MKIIKLLFHIVVRSSIAASYGIGVMYVCKDKIPDIIISALMLVGFIYLIKTAPGHRAKERERTISTNTDVQKLAEIIDEYIETQPYQILKTTTNFAQHILDNIVLNEDAVRKVFIKWLRLVPLCQGDPCAIKFIDFWKILASRSKDIITVTDLKKGRKLQ
ncbi:MAG TPA: hypothetical protein VMW42_00245 [Desulfatiglandales bacterium]|nr:hypothetical protein [Desulfatiglandales bacterium]